MSFQIQINKWDAGSFTDSVFKMFDLNGDEALTFEEFMFATSAQNFDDIHDKLGWLFDNVYDRVSLFFNPIQREIRTDCILHKIIT